VKPPPAPAVVVSVVEYPGPVIVTDEALPPQVCVTVTPLRNAFIDFLCALQELGVNHIAMNLKATRRPAVEVLQELAEHVLPLFPSNVRLP
jgi:hypothetical protein